MQGAPRRQARSWARSFFLLPLVLALLALVAFPVFAHAAGIPQYEVGENETEIHRESVKPKSNEGHSSESENQKKAHGSATGNMPGSEESGGEGQSSHSGAAGNSNSGNGPTAGESGSGGEKSAGGSKAEGSVGPGQEVAGGGGSEATGTQAASHSESGGGGSSPVVPILIVVVVLAAISIGVVIYRQRKGGPGQDGRISSPNAS